MTSQSFKGSKTAGWIKELERNSRLNKKRIIRFPLPVQMSLLYISICLLPTLLLCFYFSDAVRILSISETKEIYRYSVEQVGTNLNEKITEIAQASFAVGTDKAVVSYLSDHTEDDYRLYSTYVSTVHGLFEQLRYRFQNLRVHIYTSNPDIKFSGTFIRDDEQFLEREEALEDADGLFAWNGICREFGRDYLIASTPIKDFSMGGATVGILEIGIDREDLVAYIDEAALSDVIVLLRDQNDRVLLSNLQDTQKEQELLQVLQTPRESDIVSWDEKSYLVFQSDIENNYLGIDQWKNEHLVPLQIVEQGAREIKLTGFVVTGILALTALTILMFFSRRLTCRLKLLTDAMNHIEAGHNDVSIPVTGHDEIYDLGMHFEKMVLRIRYLMNEVYENEIKKQKLINEQKTIRLIMLQNQINPHYLFNTMETIRMNLLIKGDTETAGVIRVFADSFREMLDDSTLTCRLGEELGFVKKYFLIQKYRFEEKIDLTISADESMMNAVIPKFLLQPMVENSILHGLEQKAGNGMVFVQIERFGEVLHIRIKDNGIGMNDAELSALRESIAHPEEGWREHYALRNIARRLSLLYNGDALLELESVAGRGTHFHVCIPYSEEQITDR